jgi:hypothetical protein
MKLKNNAHLNEELISRAVIDAQELDGEERQHLLTCGVCSAKVEQIKNELQEFGESIFSAVPPPKKNVILPLEGSAPADHKPNWLPTFGVTAMAGLALFFYFLGMESMAPKMSPYQSTEMVLEDEYLMQEISEMVENPLPETLYEISGDTGDFDEDFFQFMVPDIQEDIQSNYLIQGGTKQC